ncbi:acetyl-coenzyme A synthetase 2-like, mitochondrial isoform X1 [Hemiscyllium ocellatum]|uniref:acetyl-coenzyme A synthetase 2-like, mitochondrial isoform X1 n=2 Tax=Hemiscyllium ocellatum TaxID=170820 RepID=UPI00296672A4|nr:acetyl-coenzyme A synthetase 2-like, mitochondrial isoform X1 [Hemiscyllium ocellatum]
MAAIMGGSRLLRIAFSRCPRPSASVNERTAARMKGSSQGLDPNKIRTFHTTSPAPNISSFLPESSSFPGVKSYADLLDFAIRDPETFWGTLAKERLLWNRLFQRVHDCDFSKGSIAWFLGGQLNVSVNCLDRHADQYPNRVALIWERDEPGTEIRITYRELLETTCRLANTLKRHGVQKGDRVAIYLPVSPIGIASMLACARIGAVHTVVFAGFSSHALSERISDAQCKAVITCNQGVRGGRVIELKKLVDEAVKSCPTVKCIFVAQRTDGKVPMSNIDIPLEEEMEKEEPVCEPVSMDSEDLLFLLYTSGSTGKPKGLVHTQAGYLLYTSITHKYAFDYQEGDVFGCMADIGWITGHSYVVYGPLCNGGTTVLFESTPIYPNPGRYWETVQRLQINQFYGAPTAIRLLLKYGDSWVSKYDRSSLKTLGTVGEPINHEAWEWFWKVVGDGRCTLVDTWWQTETGGVCISPRPSEEGAKILPSMAMRPFFGIQLAIMDEKGNRMEGNNVTGALCITKPWPGIARSIYGDHSRFLNAYFKKYPGYYLTGDGAHRSEEGFYKITGRMDDVINISGHRLGTAEIENALAEHPDVPETAVIGFPHDIKGEAAFAFIVLKDTCSISELVIKDLKTNVESKIAKYAIPDHILVVKRLPKTRSGKIMRRVLKKIATDETSNLGDLSTLDDPQIISEIIAAYTKYKKDHMTRK